MSDYSLLIQRVTEYGSVLSAEELGVLVHGVKQRILAYSV